MSIRGKVGIEKKKLLGTNELHLRSAWLTDVSSARIWIGHAEEPGASDKESDLMFWSSE